MAYRTIQDRISAARGRTDRAGRSHPEQTLSLTFSSSQTESLVKRFGLDQGRDGVPTIVERICNELGVATTSGRFTQTIAERADGKSHVLFSFLIDSIYALCE